MKEARAFGDEELAGRVDPDQLGERVSIQIPRASQGNAGTDLCVDKGLDPSTRVRRECPHRKTRIGSQQLIAQGEIEHAFVFFVAVGLSGVSELIRVCTGISRFRGIRLGIGRLRLCSARGCGHGRCRGLDSRDGSDRRVEAHRRGWRGRLALGTRGAQGNDQDANTVSRRTGNLDLR